jgi:hypothetical protein
MDDCDVLYDRTHFLESVKSVDDILFHGSDRFDASAASPLRPLRP